MAASFDVVCIGRIDHERLAVILAPPESYDATRGYDFRYARVYVGREGDELQPLSAEITSTVNRKKAGESIYVWSLQTSAGIFVSMFSSESAVEKRSRFTWSNAFNGGDILIRPLAMRHFTLQSKQSGAIRLASLPRQVIYAGTHGARVIAVTAVGDISSAEFYIGDATVAGWPMTRLHAVDVTAGVEKFTFYADLQSAGVFSYTTAEGYRKGQRKLLGRRQANQLFDTLNLPHRGYVGLFDGLLEAIDVHRVRFNQSYGIAWVE